MQGPYDIHLHGVVARRDLLAAGVGAGAIDDRLKRRYYLPLYRGVYAVGHANLTVAGRRRAIVLACWPGAVLSHRSAAEAWGLRPGAAGSPWDVTIPGQARLRPAAPVRIHRCRLAVDERGVLDGIPVTSVARTLFDLSSTIPSHHLRRAIERAVELQSFDRGAVERTLARRRGRPGAPALAALLADFAAHGDTHTRSDLEALFLQICLDHDIPRPVLNAVHGGREVDATWPGSDLIVEIDSYAHHRSRAAMRRDRAKDRAALRGGRRTARFTGDELEQAPAGVAAEVLTLLGHGRQPP